MKKIGAEIKFLYTEIKKSFSNEPSYFSSKRIERALLFVSAITASNVWFWTHFPNLDVSEVVFYVGTHLAYAGYTMVQTQKEKKLKLEEDGDSES